MGQDSQQQLFKTPHPALAHKNDGHAHDLTCFLLCRKTQSGKHFLNRPYAGHQIGQEIGFLSALNRYLWPGDMRPGHEPCAFSFRTHFAHIYIYEAAKEDSYDERSGLVFPQMKREKYYSTFVPGNGKLHERVRGASLSTTCCFNEKYNSLQFMCVGNSELLAYQLKSPKALEQKNEHVVIQFLPRVLRTEILSTPCQTHEKGPTFVACAAHSIYQICVLAGGRYISSAYSFRVGSRASSVIYTAFMRLSGN